MNPHLVPGPSRSVAACVTAPPLLERLRMAARSRGDSQPTAENLVSWARAFILFHNKRHPSQMGLLHVTHFLEHVVKTAPEPLPALAPGAMLSRPTRDLILLAWTNRAAKACLARGLVFWM